MEIKVGLSTNPIEAIARVSLSEINISKREWDRMCNWEQNEILNKHLIILRRTAVDKMRAALDNGRAYLMSVPHDKITVADALESFGFNQNGLETPVLETPGSQIQD